jgi:hypothetical protein
MPFVPPVLMFICDRPDTTTRMLVIRQVRPNKLRSTSLSASIPNGNLTARIVFGSQAEDTTGEDPVASLPFMLIERIVPLSDGDIHPGITPLWRFSIHQCEGGPADGQPGTFA